MGNPMRSNSARTAEKKSAPDKMSDKTFSAFQRIVMEQTGIELAESKRGMIVNRFSRRLDALGLNCFEDYLHIVAQAGHPEAREFIDTITTNLTYFFREPHHFEVLGQKVLPDLAKRINFAAPIRIWSAGCSSGAEPYSLAMVVKETPATSGRTVRILCTDIDTKMVRSTQLGNYSQDQMRGLSPARMEKWFTAARGNRYSADDELRSLLICKQLNLFDPWPIKNGVDIIMCRNVLIYFNPAYQKKLLAKFASAQKPGSYLFLGHSETLGGFKDAYRRVDNTV